MKIIQVGLNHKTAPIEIRERLAIPEPDLPDALLALCPEDDQNPGQAQEGAILSTCNRLEVYAVVQDAEAGFDGMQRQIAHVTGASPADLQRYLEFRQGEEAVSHLFQVVCGLDSMVLGESQIQGQVAEAHALALAYGTAGAVTNCLFRTAVHTGKRARTETAINKHPTSIGHVAVELAVQTFRDLSQKNALLVGAGEMAQLAAKNLAASSVGAIHVVNRSPARAAALAQQFNAVALDWSRLVDALSQADVVVSSTAAPRPVLTRAAVEAAMQMRRHRTLLIIDIAMPRDVEPAVAELPNVLVHDIDDLQQVVDTNLEQRRHEIPQVQTIIQEELAGFMAWFNALDVVPTLVDLRQHAERIREAEIERVLRRLDHLSEQEREVIRALSQRLVNKILHQPTVRLKAHAQNGRQALHYAEVVRDLFGLDVDRSGSVQDD